MRFDPQSAVVMAVALASSLSAGWWLTHVGERGQARAQPAPAASAHAPAPAGAAQVLKGPDGHFWAEATIEGRAVRVLVDTGASVVALTPSDAARLGVRPEPHDFTRPVSTASGRAMAAPVTLQAVSIGAARIDNVEALVVEAGLEQSLLGMSYLGRLSRFEASPTALLLRP